MSIEVSQKDGGFVSLTLRRASLASSTNSGYSALEFGPYACIRHRQMPNNFNLNMRTLPLTSLMYHCKYINKFILLQRKFAVVFNLSDFERYLNYIDKVRLGQ